MGTMYDIYGFKILAEGEYSKILDEEFGHFKKEISGPFDLKVKPMPSGFHSDLLTYPPGCQRGFYLPFSDDEDTIFYDEDTFLNGITNYVEMFLNWPNKTLIHAGAVSDGENAHLIVGGGGIGKTSTVLNLLPKGYSYLSDDWLVIGSDSSAYPFPKPIHLIYYNLKNTPISEKVLGNKRYPYLATVKFLDYIDSLNIDRNVNFIIKAIRGKMRIDISPTKLGNDINIGEPCKIENVYYLQRRNVEHPIKSEMNTTELARRMAFVTQYDRCNKFFEQYYKYAFEYNIENDKIENRVKNDRRIFEEAFTDVNTKKITLPHHTDLAKANNPIKMLDNLS